MYKKLDQFGEDHDKAIIKQVEKESRRLRKITPGAEVPSQVQEDTNSEASKVVDYEKMKLHRNFENNTDTANRELDEFATKWSEKMKIIAENAAQAASASCRAVEDNVQGWLICAY